MNGKYAWLFITFLISHDQDCIRAEEERELNSGLKRLLFRRQTCPNSNMCLSQWGYCGTTADYCGQGCKAGPCTGSVQASSCPDPNMCLSQYGYCGTTADYCGQGCKGGPCTGTVKPSGCPDPNMCLSQYGYCGTTADYCGQGCKGGPCTGGGGSGGGGQNNGIITDQNFACAFNNLDDQTRNQRLSGLVGSGYTPGNADEAAVFLAHVYHETGGLSTLTEYCAPGCGPNYASSWCDIQGAPGKLYYGRGWFQLSYPCNYNAAGKALGLDLLNYPDLVDHQQDVAVKTAVWFFQSNNMVAPARQGDFAATTRILNGAVECNGGPGATNQQTRVNTYLRIRPCFGLGAPTINPTC